MFPNQIRAFPLKEPDELQDVEEAAVKLDLPSTPSTFTELDHNTVKLPLSH